MKEIIYLDNAATTPVSEEVLQAMIPYFSEQYGNPSSIFYSVGAVAHQALASARQSVANSIGCEPGEVYFTSSGSEADNWALKGAAHRLAKKGKKHLITSVVEHHAILHTMSALEKEGFEVTYIPVDSEGFVSVQDVKEAIRPDTALVSIMFANNEIGTIEPVEEIAAVCREQGVWFHTDAVQAVGSIPVHFKNMGFDMMSLSAHKFNGPKGVGALIIRRGILPDILIDGGAQERGRRAGTENLAGIVGLAKALEIATQNLESKMKKLSEMRKAMLAHIEKMPKVTVNGPKDETKRLPGTLNVCFEAAESESILLFLDMDHICASSGSACASGSLDPSHVLMEIGLSHAIANCSLRLSFGAVNSIEQVEPAAQALEKAVAEVRRRSPIYE